MKILSRARKRISDRRKRRLRKRIRIITHNVRVGRRPAVVARKVRRIGRLYRADVIVLQEAHGYIDALSNLNGWRLIVAHGYGEAQGNPILVRRGSGTHRKRPIWCSRDWTGPKAGRAHRGRVFAVAEVQGWTIANVHRTRPGWSRNGAAFAEEYDRLRDLARSVAGRFVAVGDQNIGTRHGGDRGPNTPWALAKAIGGRVITTTPGHIDYAVARGATGKARRLGKYGSDHSAVLIVLFRK